MPSSVGLRKILRRPKLQVKQQPALPPGDIPKPLAPGRKVKPEEVRDLGELIRKRYELDVEIWDLRHVQPRDRSIVEDKMHTSDATLKKICATINAWDSPDAFESPKDWAKLQEIKKRIQAGGKRTWAGNPPWDDD